MTFVISLKNKLYGKPSDEWLMLQYRLTQDASYIDQLYRNCADDLYHFLLTQSDPDLAKDITHRTWLKVMEKRNYFQQGGKFKNWLFTLGRHLLIDEFRRTNKLTQLFDEQITEDDSSQRIEQTHRIAQFELALAKLPFLQREALVLSQEGFGILEISEITGEPTESIKSRIRYAKAKLKQLLRGQND